ncbi:MAG: cobalamin-binding protein [Bacteroidota bacterium]
MAARRALLLPLVLSLISFSRGWAQVSVVDDIQRTIALRSPASRIVSLAPSITESLFAIGAGDRVVGVTDYCDFPAEARRKPRVGGMINPNIEAVAGLKPDLIVMSMEGNVRDDYRRLAGLGFPVFVTNPRTLEGIYRSLTQLGTLTGCADSAVKVVDRLRARERDLRATAGRGGVRTLLVVSLQPLIVAGRNTFIHELLEAAGGVNLAAYARGNYPTYSRETVIANNPDVILITSDAISDVYRLPAMFPEWKIVSALRHKRVYRVDSNLVTRPGPRALDALASLVHLLHEQR